MGRLDNVVGVEIDLFPMILLFAALDVLLDGVSKLFKSKTPAVFCSNKVVEEEEALRGGDSRDDEGIGPPLVISGEGKRVFVGGCLIFEWLFVMDVKGSFPKVVEVWILVVWLVLKVNGDIRPIVEAVITSVFEIGVVGVGGKTVLYPRLNENEVELSEAHPDRPASASELVGVTSDCPR